MFYWLIDLSNTVPGMGMFRTFLNVFKISIGPGRYAVKGFLNVFSLRFRVQSSQCRVQSAEFSVRRAEVSPPAGPDATGPGEVGNSRSRVSEIFLRLVVGWCSLTPRDSMLT